MLTFAEAISTLHSFSLFCRDVIWVNSFRISIWAILLFSLEICGGAYAADFSSGTCSLRALIQTKLLAEEKVIPEPIGVTEGLQPFVRPAGRTASGYRLSYTPQLVRTGQDFPFECYVPDSMHPEQDILFNTAPAWNTMPIRKMPSRMLMKRPLEGFEYTPPPVMHASLPIVELAKSSRQQFTLLDANSDPASRLKEYLLRNRETMDVELTKFAEGGYSTVYSIHPPMPEEMQRQGPEQRRKWALQHAVAMAKMRRESRGEMDRRSLALAYLRDLVVGKLAKQLFERVRFRGRQLIRVANIKGNLEAAQRGIMLQVPVDGVSAMDLAIAADEVLYPGNNLADTPATKERFNREKIAKEAAVAVLKKAGFADDSGNVTESHAKDALAHIDALEHAYRLMNVDGMRYQHDTGLVIYGNHLHNGNSDVSLVGFDYGHGGNVIWDPKAKQFVMIDW